MLNCMRFLANPAIIMIILISIAPPIIAGDWQVGAGGNSSKNCISDEIGPTEPNILWQGGIPAGASRQSVIDGDIIVMPRIVNGNDVLHGTLLVAQDLQTGDSLWAVELPVDDPDNNYRNRIDCFRDGRVYATRSKGLYPSYLYALSETDGSIIWQSTDLLTYDEGSTFAANGDLIIGGSDDIRRIDATDGTTVWQTSRTSPSSDGDAAALYGDRAYIWETGNYGPKISAFDLNSGTYLYSSRGIGGVGGVEICQTSPFVGPDGTIYGPSTANSPTDSLVAFTDTGESIIFKWGVPLGYVTFATFGIGPDGSVYSYNDDYEIIRLDPETGAILNTSISISSEFGMSARMAIDANGIIFVTNGGYNGAFFSFDPDLTLRWSESLYRVSTCGPALGNDGTLVICQSYNVTAYRTTASGIFDNGFTDDATLPTIMTQNYPNPFNATTTIEYQLPEPANVRINIYDVIGRKIETLADGFHLAGYHSVDWNANEQPSGTYFYHIQAGDITETKKMVLLK